VTPARTAGAIPAERVAPTTPAERVTMPGAASLAAAATLIGLAIAYPLTSGQARAGLTVAIVGCGFAASVAHAWWTRGPRVAATLVTVTAGGGFGVEALGVATGLPFGHYAYAGTLGPAVAGVPVVVPLAWTWMAWPAWLAAVRLLPARRTAARIGVAAVGLASWDLFLDPQMVAAGYWRWTAPGSLTLPGVSDVPVSNFAGWLAVAALMMATLMMVAVATGAGPAAVRREPADAVMHALYLWTYASSVLAHAVFFGQPGSAAWGALGMGTVAVPLAVRLARR
jgi:uncharacterized membrane protein